MSPLSLSTATTLAAVTCLFASGANVTSAAVSASCCRSRASVVVTREGSPRCAGLHAGVTLILVDEIDVSRGDLIVRDDRVPEPRRRLDATVCWLGDAPLDTRRKYLLRHTTREVRARVDRIDHLWDVATQQRENAPLSLAMNDIAQITLTLAQPICPDRYADNRATGSFILIDETTNNTIAAGLIA